MLKILTKALKGGIATNEFPSVVAGLPEGYRGKPVIDAARCSPCETCVAACPTNAITLEQPKSVRGSGVVTRTLSINYGNCIFCGECEAACPDAVHLSREVLHATSKKSDLTTRINFTVNKDGTVASVETSAGGGSGDANLEELGQRVREKVQKLYGRSLHIREVDAGSCNGCEVEITALNNPVYDVERFGVHFVASPRHADMLLVTGPVTHNMEIALKQTYDATPEPRLVVAVGACAIAGGIFGKSYASCGGADSIVPVDVYIPGCPPRPEALLQGILLAMGRVG